jgi:hypothetical protein
MIEPTPTREETPDSRSPQSQQILILSVIGGAVLLLAAVVIIVVLGLRGTDQASDATPTPTESVLPTPPPSSPAPPPSCETIISSGDVEVSVALPTLLTLRDTPFPVEPIVPEGDVWSYPADRSATAVWVCGTVINYVIGLEPTPENETLVTSLTPGDEVTLQLTSGAVLPFRFAGRGEVVAGDADALTQQQPRLTLVLTQGDTWQIATADYVAEAESIEPPPSGTLVQLGQPAQIGEAVVIVNRGHVERVEDLPPGTMYYVVEYSVENRGETPLTIDGYSMKLQDGVGNAYLLSPPGSEAGDFGPLSGEIAPGSSAQGSAGYLVPDPLPDGPLVWSFSSRAEPGAQANVSIPYESEAGGEPSVERAEVALTDAFFSSDGNTLILEGEVRNTGTETLNIEEGDIRLSSSAGLSDLFLAAPPLPWAIEPGQRQVIELQYQRPGASTVLLELLGYSFEIGGLQ